MIAKTKSLKKEVRTSISPMTSELDKLRQNALRFIELINLTNPAVISQVDDVQRRQAKPNCLGCDTMLKQEKIIRSLFCSELCQQEAQLVRYMRRAVTDSRIKDWDVQIAIGTRLLMLAGGGYPVRSRKLTKIQKEFILVRDKHLCRLCKKPATEIDHIKGNSSDPSNLQAVCGSCNRKKAMANAITVTPESNPELYLQIENQRTTLALRIVSEVPSRLCDDEKNWNVVWRSIIQARKSTLLKISRPKTRKRER